MHGPYKAMSDGNNKTILYVGNKVSKPIADVKSVSFDQDILDTRLDDITKKEEYYHLHKIDNAVFYATVDYFRSIDADWCNLPLTTKMISSPGEVYAGKVLDYTTDTLPVDISWFGESERIYLSESSQFYLELRLLIDNVDQVFSIYNSFRKESADFCHLSEFQHIEYEGKVGFEKNIEIFMGLMRYIVSYVLEHNQDSLAHFLTLDEIEDLNHTFDDQNIARLPFKEALDILYKDTNDSRYTEFSMKHFSSWEEIRLTELLSKHVIVTDFPVLQIPFYHNTKKQDGNGIALAENADFILYGYRETVGSGTRISDPAVLLQKAKQFNLPEEDYAPYLKTRDYDHYQETSGFGLGWQRLTQWLLKLPVIWEASHIPRGHHAPRP
jgi:aspartyl/asparaginyl-tRNA synthetase